MKRTQSAAVVLACSLGLSSCETYPHDKATALVTAPYPGKNEVNACKPYADALCMALAANHIPAWCVVYWRNNMFGPQGHAMVVYRDAGSYWCADNAFPYPTKCEGTTPLQWAQERECVWLAEQNMNRNAIVCATAMKGDTLLAKQTHFAHQTVMVAGSKPARHQKHYAGIAGIPHKVELYAKQ